MKNSTRRRTPATASTRAALPMILALLLLLPAAAALADSVPTQEAPLTAGGQVFEVNRNGATYLYVSDSKAGEVWVVDAATGDYTQYTGITGATDAKPEADGDIWWTDSETVIGRIDVAAGTVTRWDASAWDPERSYDLAGVTVDEDGLVWISEGSGYTSKLWSFDAAGSDLCGYALSGGSVSQYVVHRDGMVWLANYSNDRLIRMDPVTNVLTWWQMPSGFVEGLAVDAAGNFWMADNSAARLYRYVVEAQITTYVLPSGSTPHIVAPAEGGVWYTAGSGSAGLLDPSTATGSSAPPSNWDEKTLAAPVCVDMGAGTTTPAAQTTGSLAWTSSTWTTVVAPAGWTIYQLPAGASPYGIASSSGYVWVSDQGRQKLARLALAPVVTIAKSGTSDVRLEWLAMAGAASYQVWQSSLPFFTPGDSSSPSPVQDSAALTYTQTGAFTALTNYYYVVRSVTGGQPSANSNRTGKFTFSLTPGSS